MTTGRQPPPRPRNLVALLLGLITGLGHIYLGHHVLGSALFSAFITALNAMFLGATLHTVARPELLYWGGTAALVAVWVGSLVHVYQLSYGTDRSRLAREKDQLLRDALLDYLRDDLDDAIRKLERAVRLDVDWQDPDPLFHLGVVYARLAERRAQKGETGGARQARRRAQAAYRSCQGRDLEGKWAPEIANELKRMRRKVTITGRLRPIAPAWTESTDMLPRVSELELAAHPRGESDLDLALPPSDELEPLPGEAPEPEASPPPSSTERLLSSDSDTFTITPAPRRTSRRMARRMRRLMESGELDAKTGERIDKGRKAPEEEEPPPDEQASRFLRSRIAETGRAARPTRRARDLDDALEPDAELEPHPEPRPRTPTIRVSEDDELVELELGPGPAATDEDLPLAAERPRAPGPAEDAAAAPPAGATPVEPVDETAPPEAPLGEGSPEAGAEAPTAEDPARAATPGGARGAAAPAEADAPAEAPTEPAPPGDRSGGPAVPRGEGVEVAVIVAPGDGVAADASTGGEAEELLDGGRGSEPALGARPAKLDARPESPDDERPAPEEGP